MAWTKKGLQEALYEIGYVRSPNNIHSNLGEMMYAGGPGILEPQSQQVEVFEEEIIIRKGNNDVEARFTSLGAYLEYLKEYGKISEPGQAGYYD